MLLIVSSHGVAATALRTGLVGGSALGVYRFDNDALVYDVLRVGERGCLAVFAIAPVGFGAGT